MPSGYARTTLYQMSSGLTKFRGMELRDMAGANQGHFPWQFDESHSFSLRSGHKQDIRGEGRLERPVTAGVVLPPR